MIWVKDQLNVNPKLPKHHYDNNNRAKTINSADTLKKYYGNVNDTVKLLRDSLYKYVKFINNKLAGRIINYYNQKQGHYMYDGILNEKTPDHNYTFVPKKYEQNKEI